MKSLNNLTLFLLVCSGAGFAQTPFRGNQDSLRVNLIVAQSSDNTFTKGKKAEIIGTFPDSVRAKRSWMTNAYVEIGLSSDSTRWTFGLTGELHRNTLIEKEQDVVQYGISITKILEKKVDGSVTSEIPISLAVKLSEDDVAKTETLQTIAGLTYNRLTGRAFLKTQTAFPAAGTSFGKLLQFSHNHNVGLAYLGSDENVLLGQLDFELNAYPFSSLSKKWMDKLDLFKVQATYKARTEFIGNTELDLSSFIDLQAGINISFGPEDTNSVGVAYDWIRGADPLQGLADQKYQTVTAKVRFVIQ